MYEVHTEDATIERDAALAIHLARLSNVIYFAVDTVGIWNASNIC